MANATRRITESAALIGLLYTARRYYRNWGATKAECQMVLPGDTLVSDPAIQTTEALYIDAPVAAVWSELLAAGRRRSDADAESRPLAVGDVVRPTPDGVTLTVTELVAEKYVVLTVAGADRRWNAVWSLHIQPHWEDRVRLLTRARIALRHPGEVFALEMVRPAIALGTRALLLGVKHRVERCQASEEVTTCATRSR